MSEPTPTTRLLQYGLKGLFTAVTGAAVWMGLAVSFPPVVIFGTAVILVALAFWAFVRRRNRFSRRKRISTVLLSCLVLYVASAGPASLLSQNSQRVDNIVEVAYAPLILLDNTRVRHTRVWHALGSYINAWEKMAQPPQ